MPQATWRIEALGDRCAIIEFEQRVDLEINEAVRSSAALLLAHPIDGVTDVVPAFSSIAIHYRPEIMLDGLPGTQPYAQLCKKVHDVLAQHVASERVAPRVIEVPVCYGGEFGPDLAEVASACRLTPERVVELHGASSHVVYMLGFAPGFPYLGGLDPRLAMPRRSTPRTRVPAGTVAIAREQSAIYSIETPGGWNMLGRTPLRMFIPEGDPPSLLCPGDEVHFVPISIERYHAMQDEQA